MNIGQLRETIADFPDDMVILVGGTLAEDPIGEVSYTWTPLYGPNPERPWQMLTVEVADELPEITGTCFYIGR